MELYKIAAIAMNLYEKILSIETDACRREWQFSLYWVLNRVINNICIDLNWEDEYSQWNIDHLFRSKVTALKHKYPSLTVTVISMEELESGIMIKGKLGLGKRKNEDFRFCLSTNEFIPLDEISHNGRRILFETERFDIIASLLELEEVRHGIAERHPGRFPDKVRSLIEVLRHIRDVYAAQNETGKNFIETVVGASIFYLPHPVNECFSGYCSIEALKDKINGKSIVREHITPRKYAAREVLTNTYNIDNFYDDFKRRYRRFMYLTGHENKKTVNYTEETHDEALLSNDIEKFPVGESPFVNNHTLFVKFIGYCRENIRHGQAISVESAMRLLTEFRGINDF